jgi:hypothetical protein
MTGGPPLGPRPERSVDHALARLAASRTQLRQQLLPAPRHPDGRSAEGGAGGMPRRLQAVWRWARRRLGGASPVLGMAVQAVQGWWQVHPWRSTGELVAQELHAGVTPLIRRHPLATMLAAASLGAALMIWKPWRWSPVRRQLRPLPRHAGRWLLRQLAQPSVQAMLAGLFVSAGLGRAAQQAAHAHGPADERSSPPPGAATPPWPDLPEAHGGVAASTAAHAPAADAMPAQTRQQAAID